MFEPEVRVSTYVHHLDRDTVVLVLVGGLWWGRGGNPGRLCRCVLTEGALPEG
jgi:hypothetical protein